MHSLKHSGKTLMTFLKASEELEDRESLAAMAASGQVSIFQVTFLLESNKQILTLISTKDDETGDGETFIEKYTRGVSAVETILTLDKLRQSVAIKELVRYPVIVFFIGLIQKAL